MYTCIVNLVVFLCRLQQTVEPERITPKVKSMYMHMLSLYSQQNTFTVSCVHA